VLLVLEAIPIKVPNIQARHRFATDQPSTKQLLGACVGALDVGSHLPWGSVGATLVDYVLVLKTTV